MTLDPVVAITDISVLGSAIASRLATRGWRIAVYHPALKTPHAEALVHQLGAERAHAHPFVMEKWKTLDDAVAATTAHFGQSPRHAVIAFDQWEGMSGGPLHIGGSDDNGVYRRLTTANAETVYRTMRAVLPAMVEARDGSIVVIGSRLGERPDDGAGAAPYAAAKAAVLAFVQAAAREVASHGVRVNAIVTSMSDSPEARAAMPGFDAAKWVSPEAIAKVVAFLVSDDARAVTGATIPMYGEV
jgi:NAD(P)-dependent dehydrogenase (short-subunit alcohol dehydrogenase family)